MIKILLVILCVIAVAIVAVVLFLQTPSFGRLPRGERLERIKRSPNFRDGEFRNMEPTVLMTSEKGKWGAMLDFVFKKSPEGLRPEHPVPSVKTDLRALDPDRELWYGSGILPICFNWRQAYFGRPRVLRCRSGIFPE